ncbi:hypothetical protein [Kibdelosporangium phytohabitans]|uniref:Uncharacterized protein n=1 Tax=Kibdelosporangium phytohabitans TaxID=860235 RepID=A0A0N9I181_9PSEU|nr:hypothetical protein [Kibdelosporangium phytohabitans]ALG09569.1 hypothetical protein AOZ06_24070 [Kibdelosporangium phytohabitans]MBE1469109.1 hypothetical protein [Kibdelosporangium phytohabitans]
MSNTPEETAKADDEQPQAIGPVERLKLLPMTTPFGLRAAVLAGLVLSAGAATAGVFDDPSGGVSPICPICSMPGSEPA